MFSVRFRVRVHVRVRRRRRRRRRNDFCFSRQNRFSLTLDIWDKESICPAKCNGWPWPKFTAVALIKKYCLQDKVRTTQPSLHKLVAIFPLSCFLPDKILEEFCWKPFARFSWKFCIVFFQSQTLYWTYIRNDSFDWCHTNKRYIKWILGKLCDLDLWPHLRPWSLISQGQFSKKLYLRNWYLTDVKQKESISIRYWTNSMVLPLDHTRDPDLVVLRSKLEITLFKEWVVWCAAQWLGDFGRLRAVDISSLKGKFGRRLQQVNNSLHANCISQWWQKFILGFNQ